MTILCDEVEKNSYEMLGKKYMHCKNSKGKEATFNLNQITYFEPEDYKEGEGQTECYVIWVYVIKKVPFGFKFKRRDSRDAFYKDLNGSLAEL